MALINSSHPTLAEDQLKYWEDELKNKRALLFELENLIYQLLQDDKKSYNMDTGQTSINVTLHDLPSLIDKQEKLVKQIEYLEGKLGLNELNSQPSMFQGVPVW